MTRGPRWALATAAVLLLAAVVAAGFVLGVQRLVRGGEGATIDVDFRDARGLVADADVIVGGAKAGRVERISLTDAGTARVRLRLHEGLEPPRADASAAIRPADLLGDVVLDLSPGHDRRPLRGPIAVARTVDAPRLEQLLESFDGPVRDGLRALLVAGGQALAGRGEDLARTLVALRPAITAGDGVLRELDDQDAALSSVVADAERAVGALAATAPDGERALVALERRLTTVVAVRRPLDDGLRGLPATLGRLRTTAASLTATAGRLRPLARDLRALAPGLTTAADRVRPFLGRARRASSDLIPALRQLRGALVGREGTWTALTQGLGTAAAVAPDLDRLLTAVEDAAPAISKGFFVNFTDQGAEPGTQPADPFADPARNYWRGAAVFSCEAFGVPIEPGCLLKALGRDK
ncbi:MlaD family protein [Patulibacter defluvii]|uniref:MlaD family protein n=1 Tax=Patulibacter defluvii TaxID=3095358 RepID=UPI002A749CE7|nr:MlaD family protein [Patulibacter sp. DM4]